MPPYAISGGINRDIILVELAHIGMFAKLTVLQRDDCPVNGRGLTNVGLIPTSRQHWLKLLC